VKTFYFDHCVSEQYLFTVLVSTSMKNVPCLESYKVANLYLAKHWDTFSPENFRWVSHKRHLLVSTLLDMCEEHEFICLPKHDFVISVQASRSWVTIMNFVFVGYILVHQCFFHNFFIFLSKVGVNQCSFQATAIIS